MKKIILLFIIQLFLFAPRLQAQNFWEQLPFPDTINIANLAVNNQGYIFVGTVSSNTNGIFRSTDQGQTWAHVLNTGSFQIYSLGISDSGYLYISTNGVSNFYASYDNGNTWQPLPYPLIAGASRIYCIGVDTLLVASGTGNGVLLLRTPDRGITWDTLFTTNNHPGEYISDIAIAPDGTIYFCMMCYFPNQGGVYKSTDNGSTWQYVGLINKQILDIELNAAGDLYIGVFSGFVGSGGVFVLRHNSSIIDTCLYGPYINGLVVNPAGYIYAGIGFPNGVIVSKDNGTTFEFENSGLPIGPMGQLEIDYQSYIYARPDAPSFRLFRTVEPTYVSIKSKVYIDKRSLLNIYPNPVTDIAGIQLNGKVIPDGHYEMYLYEVSSKKVLFREVTINDNQFQIPLNHLTCGTYAIRLNVDSRIYFGTFIKL